MSPALLWSTRPRRLVLAGLSIALSWTPLRLLIAADRGLDLTDEGLYLLAAQPPSIDAAWGTPWGWHTAPLMSLAAGDLAAFRTLGAVLIFWASALLGWSATLLGQVVRGPTIASRRESLALALERALGASLGALGGLLYFGGLLRTPSYNWVTVFGATVAVTGLILSVALHISEDTTLQPAAIGGLLAGQFGRRTAVSLMAFGVFFSVPAKPTTAIFFALIAALMFQVVSDTSTALQIVAVVTVLALIFAALALLGGLWSVNIWNVFLAALRSPPLDDRQTLLGGLLAVRRVPRDLLATWPLVVGLFAFMGVVVARSPNLLRVVAGKRILKLANLAFALFGAVLAFAALAEPVLSWVYARPAEEFAGFIMRNRSSVPLEDYVRHYRGQVLRLVPVSLGFWVGSFLEEIPPKPRTALVFAWIVVALQGWREVLQLVNLGDAIENLQYRQFVNARLTADAIIVVLGAALLLMLSEPRLVDCRSWRVRVASSAAAAVVVFAFATGFGSGHGLVQQASLASALLVAAALVLASAKNELLPRMVALAAVCLFVTSTLVLQTLANRTAPYGVPPLEQHQVATPVGPDGSELRLDRETADFLNGLAAAAEAAGWSRGVGLIDVSDAWLPGAAWHLGARVPKTLGLTMPGYPNSDALFDFRLSFAMDERFAEAWILTDELQGTLEAPTRSERAAAHLGKRFPVDYELVFAGHHSFLAPGREVQLWRPSAD